MGYGRANTRRLRPGMLPAALRFARRAGKLGIACRRRFSVIKVLQDAALDLVAKHALDALDQGLVFTGDKGEGIAGLCGAAGAADPVCVGVRGVGDIVVDDMGYARDIDAAGRDIGRHEDLVRTVAEPVERCLALVLRQVALERSSLVAGLFELLPDALGPVLRARKDQDGFRIRVLEESP